MKQAKFSEEYIIIKLKTQNIYLYQSALLIQPALNVSDYILYPSSVITISRWTKVKMIIIKTLFWAFIFRIILCFPTSKPVGDTIHNAARI